MRYPKRLIEVDLPIKRISAHARREKSIRHGHISTLHIWWARRPLAACRAVICAALWPDPVDENCPQSFRDLAADYITNFAKKAATDEKLSKHCSNEVWSKWQVLAKPENKLETNNHHHLNILRNSLLDFIADFANWDNSTQRDYLETSRNLTQAAHEAVGGIPGTKPLVVDPFAGGGAIPLEALRVGADAFASDVNPVAVLLNKMVLEFIPKYGQQLADQVQKWGQWVKEEAQKELDEFYPKDPDGSTPIAYLWARTIICEGPGCGVEIPLIKSLWLGKKPHNSWSVRLVPNLSLRKVDFEIIQGDSLKLTKDGTVKRGSANCPCCGYTTPVKSVREQLKIKNGGTSTARLFCVVTVHPNEKGRFYRLPTDQDLKAIDKAAIFLKKRKELSKKNISLTPDEPTPIGGGSGAGRAFSQRNYGMEKFEHLFTQRQLVTLTTLCEKVATITEKTNTNDLATEIVEAIQLALAFNIDKIADYGSSLATWSSPASQETVRNTFSRQALSMSWDFAEAYPFANSSGGWIHNLEFLNSPISAESQALNNQGTVVNTSAINHPLPNESVDAFITDPPYYDAVPYADLSDFFLVWLKRSIVKNSIFSVFPYLSPKEDECVVDEVKGHDRLFFEKTMTAALSQGKRLVSLSGVGVIVFAHKSTAGWEAQLKALIDAGWIITGSWPIDTERAGRMRANASAALASSVHIVCRPRNTNDIGDWRDVLQELPQRIHEWMPRLASEGVVGADAIFACLGPALEIFSRYSSVEKASGELVTLKEYLEYVWAAVSKEALSMIFDHADTISFEEDARLTAMWLWTISTDNIGNSDSSKPETDDEDEDEETSNKTSKTGGYVLEFDAARKIAQGLGAHLEQLTRLVEIKGSTARLLPVSERTKYLFGKEESQTPTKTKGKTKGKKKEVQQLNLFEMLGIIETEDDTDWGEKTVPQLGNTTLDRIHQSMILFAAGRSEALKRFLVEEGAGNDQRFWGLAQALSALYPTGTDEKRWVDGVLARKKGLGF